MGADTKALKIRIKSVDSTLHLTKAMGLVASSKIRRATDAMLKGREYARAVENILSLLTGNNECKKSLYMRKNDSEKQLIILVAGDRGMAGGYNANVFKFAKEFPNVEILPIGKRACDKFGSGYMSAEDFSSADAAELSERICSEYLSGKYGKIGVISTEYVSMLSQEAKIKWLLPLEQSPAAKASITFEPDEATILKTAVAEYISGTVYSLVKESFACEVAARRTAMDSAGKNAQQMIDELQLKYNRARQGAITQEITEIVAGAGE